MKIVRERPCQRRYHRVTAPLLVTMPDGEQRQATNWSLGGMRIDGLARTPAAGETVTLKALLPFQGFDISCQIDAVVMRSDPDTGMAALEYEQLSERTHDLLSHFIEDLVRGQMATVEDTICRIDVPVTPISTEPDANPAGDVPVRRWPLKTIAYTAFYSVLGLGVFVYMSTLVYSTTTRLEVTSAVVSAPVATLKMPDHGRLIPVRMQAGLQVGRGDVLARVENPQLVNELQVRRIELRQAQDAFARLGEKLRVQESRMALYRIVKRTDLQIAQAKVDSARLALLNATQNFERISTLYDKGLIEMPRYEDAQNRRAETESRLKEAEFDLERTTAMESVSDRLFYNNKEIVADLDLLALEVEEAGAHVAAVSMQVDRLEQSLANSVVRAPFNGRIVRVFQHDNSGIVRSEPLVVVERSEDLSVTAFLTQEEVLNIGLDDRAKVYLPALGRHVEASVTKIDRNAAFLDADASHYAWTDHKARSAAVSLVPVTADARLQAAGAGLPAVVIFPKRTTNDLYHRAMTTVGNIVGGGDET